MLFMVICLLLSSLILFVDIFISVNVTWATKYTISTVLHVRPKYGTFNPKMSRNSFPTGDPNILPQDQNSTKPPPAPVFQKEHVSEPLVEPLSEVSTGSGHEADDEAEDDTKEIAVRKIRNAINELAAINAEKLNQSDGATVLAEKREPSHNTHLSTQNSKTDSERSKSIEDSYSFSYSDSSSVVSSETQEPKDDNEKFEPGSREGKEPEKKSDANNEEKISCRIVTNDNQSIEYHHHHSKSYKPEEKNVEKHTSDLEPKITTEYSVTKGSANEKPYDMNMSNIHVAPLATPADKRTSNEFFRDLTDEVLQKAKKERTERSVEAAPSEGHLDDTSDDYEDCLAFTEDSLSAKETSKTTPRSPKHGHKSKKKLSLSRKIIGFTEGKLKHVLKNSEMKNVKDYQLHPTKPKKIAPKPPITNSEEDDDISMAELKELEELSKYKNILKEKIDYTHMKEKEKMQKSSLKEAKPKKLEDLPPVKIKANCHVFEVNPTIEFYYPDIFNEPIVQESCPAATEAYDCLASETNQIVFTQETKYEAPEGILKKGQTNKSKVNLAVNFAEKEDIKEHSDTTSFSFDSALQQTKEYNELLQDAENKVLSMNDTLQKIEDNLRDNIFINEETPKKVLRDENANEIQNGVAEETQSASKLSESNLEAKGECKQSEVLSLKNQDYVIQVEPMWKTNCHPIDTIEEELKKLNDTLKEFHESENDDMDILIKKMENVLHINDSSSFGKLMTGPEKEESEEETKIDCHGEVKEEPSEGIKAESLQLKEHELEDKDKEKDDEIKLDAALTKKNKLEETAKFITDSKEIEKLSANFRPTHNRPHEITIKVGIKPTEYLDHYCISQIDNDVNWQSWKTKDERIIDEILDTVQPKTFDDKLKEDRAKIEKDKDDIIYKLLDMSGCEIENQVKELDRYLERLSNEDLTKTEEIVEGNQMGDVVEGMAESPGTMRVNSNLDTDLRRLDDMVNENIMKEEMDSYNDMELYDVLLEVEHEWVREEKTLEKSLEDLQDVAGTKEPLGIRQLREFTLDTMKEEMQDKWRENERKLDEVLMEASARECVENIIKDAKDAIETTTLNEIDQVKNEIKPENDVKCNEILKNVNDNTTENQPQQTKTNEAHISSKANHLASETKRDTKPELTESQVRIMFQQMENNIKEKQFLKQVKKTANDVVKNIEFTLQYSTPPMSLSGLLSEQPRSTSSSTSGKLSTEKNLLEARCGEILDDYDEVDYLKRTLGYMHLQQHVFSPNTSSSYLDYHQHCPVTRRTETNDDPKRYDQELKETESWESGFEPENINNYVSENKPPDIEDLVLRLQNSMNISSNTKINYAKYIENAAKANNDTNELNTSSKMESTTSDAEPGKICAKEPVNENVKTGLGVEKQHPKVCFQENCFDTNSSQAKNDVVRQKKCSKDKENYHTKNNNSTQESADNSLNKSFECKKGKQTYSEIRKRNKKTKDLISQKKVDDAPKITSNVDDFSNKPTADFLKVHEEEPTEVLVTTKEISQKVLDPQIKSSSTVPDISNRSQSESKKPPKIPIRVRKTEDYSCKAKTGISSIVDSLSNKTDSSSKKGQKVRRVKKPKDAEPPEVVAKEEVKSFSKENTSNLMDLDNLSNKSDGEPHKEQTTENAKEQTTEKFGGSCKDDLSVSSNVDSLSNNSNLEPKKMRRARHKKHNKDVEDQKSVSKQEIIDDTIDKAEVNISCKDNLSISSNVDSLSNNSNSEPKKVRRTSRKKHNKDVDAQKDVTKEEIIDETMENIQVKVSFRDNLSESSNVDSLSNKSDTARKCVSKEEFLDDTPSKENINDPSIVDSSFNKSDPLSKKVQKINNKRQNKNVTAKKSISKEEFAEDAPENAQLHISSKENVSVSSEVDSVSNKTNSRSESVRRAHSGIQNQEDAADAQKNASKEEFIEYSPENIPFEISSKDSMSVSLRVDSLSSRSNSRSEKVRKTQSEIQNQEVAAQKNAPTEEFVEYIPDSAPFRTFSKESISVCSKVDSLSNKSGSRSEKVRKTQSGIQNEDINAQKNVSKVEFVEDVPENAQYRLSSRGNISASFKENSWSNRSNSRSEKVRKTLSEIQNQEFTARKNVSKVVFVEDVPGNAQCRPYSRGNISASSKVDSLSNRSNSRSEKVRKTQSGIQNQEVTAQKNVSKVGFVEDVPENTQRQISSRRNISVSSKVDSLSNRSNSRSEKVRKTQSGIQNQEVAAKKNISKVKFVEDVSGNAQCRPSSRGNISTSSKVDSLSNRPNSRSKILRKTQSGLSKKEVSTQKNVSKVEFVENVPENDQFKISSTENITVSSNMDSLSNRSNSRSKRVRNTQSDMQNKDFETQKNVSKVEFVEDVPENVQFQISAKDSMSVSSNMDSLSSRSNSRSERIRQIQNRIQNQGVTTQKNVSKVEFVEDVAENVQFKISSKDTLSVSLKADSLSNSRSKKVRKTQSEIQNKDFSAQKNMSKEEFIEEKVQFSSKDNMSVPSKVDSLANTSNSRSETVRRTLNSDVTAQKNISKVEFVEDTPENDQFPISSKDNMSVSSKADSLANKSNSRTTQNPGVVARKNVSKVEFVEDDMSVSSKADSLSNSRTKRVRSTQNVTQNKDFAAQKNVSKEGLIEDVPDNVRFHITSKDNMSFSSNVDSMSNKSNPDSKGMQHSYGGVKNEDTSTQNCTSSQGRIIDNIGIYEAPNKCSNTRNPLDFDNFSNKSEPGAKREHKIQTEIQNRCTVTQRIISQDKFSNDINAIMKSSKGKVSCFSEAEQLSSRSCPNCNKRAPPLNVSVDKNLDLNKEIDELVLKLTNGLKISESTKPPLPMYENRSGNFASCFRPNQYFDVFEMMNDNTLLQTPLTPTQISVTPNNETVALCQSVQGGHFVSIPNSSSPFNKNLSKSANNEFPKMPFAEFSKLASDITNYKNDTNPSASILKKPKFEEDLLDSATGVDYKNVIAKSNLAKCSKPIKRQKCFPKNDLLLVPDNLELPASPNISTTFLDVSSEKDIWNDECDCSFDFDKVEFPTNVDDLVLPKTPIIRIPTDESATYHGQSSTGIFCGRNTINVHKRHLEPNAPNGHATIKIESHATNVLSPVIFGRLKAGSSNEESDVEPNAPQRQSTETTQAISVPKMHPTTLPFRASPNELDTGTNRKEPNELEPGNSRSPVLESNQEKSEILDVDGRNDRGEKEPNVHPKCSARVGIGTSEKFNYWRPTGKVGNSAKTKDWTTKKLVEPKHLEVLGRPMMWNFSKYGLNMVQSPDIKFAINQVETGASERKTNIEGIQTKEGIFENWSDQRYKQLRNFESTVLGTDPDGWGVSSTMPLCPTCSSETLEELEVWNNKLDDYSKVKTLRALCQEQISSPVYVRCDHNNLIYEKTHNNHDKIYYKMVYNEKEKSYSIVYKPIKDGNEVVKKEENIIKLHYNSPQKDYDKPDVAIKKSRKDVFLLHGAKYFESFHGVKGSETSFCNCFEQLFNSNDKETTVYSVPSNSPSLGVSTSSLRSYRNYMKHRWKPKTIDSCPIMKDSKACDQESSEIVKDEILALEKNTEDLDETLLLLQIAKYKLLKMVEENESELSERTLSYETEMINVNHPVYMLDNLSSSDAFFSYSPPRKYQRKSKQENKVLDWSSDEETGDRAKDAKVDTEKIPPKKFDNSLRPESQPKDLVTTTNAKSVSFSDKGDKIIEDIYVKTDQLGVSKDLSRNSNDSISECFAEVKNAIKIESKKEIFVEEAIPDEVPSDKPKPIGVFGDVPNRKNIGNGNYKERAMVPVDSRKFAVLSRISKPMYDIANFLNIRVLFDLSKSYIHSLPNKQNEIGKFIVNASNNIVEFLAPQILAIEYIPKIPQKATENIVEVNSFFDLENEIKGMVGDLMREFEELKHMCLEAYNNDPKPSEEGSLAIVKNILGKIIDNVHKKAKINIKEETNLEICALRTKKEHEILKEIFNLPPTGTKKGSVKPSTEESKRDLLARSFAENIVSNILENVYKIVEQKQKEELTLEATKAYCFGETTLKYIAEKNDHKEMEDLENILETIDKYQNVIRETKSFSENNFVKSSIEGDFKIYNSDSYLSEKKLKRKRKKNQRESEEIGSIIFESVLDRVFQTIELKNDRKVKEFEDIFRKGKKKFDKHSQSDQYINKNKEKSTPIIDVSTVGNHENTSINCQKDGGLMTYLQNSIDATKEYCVFRLSEEETGKFSINDKFDDDHKDEIQNSERMDSGTIEKQNQNSTEGIDKREEKEDKPLEKDNVIEEYPSISETNQDLKDVTTGYDGSKKEDSSAEMSENEGIDKTTCEATTKNILNAQKNVASETKMMKLEEKFPDSETNKDKTEEIVLFEYNSPKKENDVPGTPESEENNKKSCETKISAEKNTSSEIKIGKLEEKSSNSQTNEGIEEENIPVEYNSPNKENEGAETWKNEGTDKKSCEEKTENILNEEKNVSSEIKIRKSEKQCCKMKIDEDIKEENEFVDSIDEENVYNLEIDKKLCESKTKKLQKTYSSETKVNMGDDNMCDVKKVDKCETSSNSNNLEKPSSSIFTLKALFYVNDTKKKKKLEEKLSDVSTNKSASSKKSSISTFAYNLFNLVMRRSDKSVKADEEKKDKNVSSESSVETTLQNVNYEQETNENEKIDEDSDEDEEDKKSTCSSLFSYASLELNDDKEKIDKVNDDEREVNQLKEGRISQFSENACSEKMKKDTNKEKTCASLFNYDILSRKDSIVEPKKVEVKKYRKKKTKSVEKTEKIFTIEKIEEICHTVNEVIEKRMREFEEFEKGSDFDISKKCSDSSSSSCSDSRNEEDMESDEIMAKFLRYRGKLDTEKKILQKFDELKGTIVNQIHEILDEKKDNKNEKTVPEVVQQKNSLINDCVKQEKVPKKYSNIAKKVDSKILITKPKKKADSNKYKSSNDVMNGTLNEKKCNFSQKSVSAKSSGGTPTFSKIQEQKEKTKRRLENLNEKMNENFKKCQNKFFFVENGGFYKFIEKDQMIHMKLQKPTSVPKNEKVLMTPRPQIDEKNYESNKNTTAVLKTNSINAKNINKKEKKSREDSIDEGFEDVENISDKSKNSPPNENCEKEELTSIINFMISQIEESERKAKNKILYTPRGIDMDEEHFFDAIDNILVQKNVKSGQKMAKSKTSAEKLKNMIHNFVSYNYKKIKNDIVYDFKPMNVETKDYYPYEESGQKQHEKIDAGDKSAELEITNNELNDNVSTNECEDEILEKSAKKFCFGTDSSHLLNARCAERVKYSFGRPNVSDTKK